ncbi:hypothetical protein FD754_010002 [Muntiacus muntjak]|uniref:Small ribosomal subunit protein uS17 N-terminal domain-containing protein n=1 Tax=Muntiacus muntjak TaxID=9888 RepID=A0A5N3X060_MUNMU|nr:hypothetical protein FD754_010002 [Muntiacus muntjak]
MMGLQTKCAYQKQPTNFQNKKRVLLNVGLGFKTLKEAIEGIYIDKKHRGHCHRSGTLSQWASVGPLPLQGTVSFNVLKVTKAAGTKKQFQKF